MTALITTTDQLSGWLLVIGCGFVAAVWVGLVNYPRLSDWWAESKARKAERILGLPSFAPTLDAGGGEYESAWEKHVADALAHTERVAHLAPVAPVIPLRVPAQREAGDAS